MEIELERTFLLKNIPADLENFKSIEIIDIYFPKLAKHPVMRVRKRGNIFEITKKYPVAGNDSSEQEEHTIALTEYEFNELAQIKGKRFHKKRYFYPYGGRTAEVDIYLDKLEGLGVVDFEFSSQQEKNDFRMPDFCLADVTQDEIFAGGMLAGKKYANIGASLGKYGYKRIVNRIQKSY